MARADREAVLRGVNARFDETGDDDAVIAALGSPTFAAVSVLRGYTPPEDSDGEDSYYEEEEYQYAEPASDSGEAEAGSPAEPVEEAPDTAEEAASDVEAPQEAPAGDAPENAAPEAEAGAMDEPSPGQAPPEAEPEAPESAEPEEPETAAEPESDAGAGLEPEEPSAEAEPEPEIEQPEPVESAVPEFETVDIGLGTIEVYSDGSAGAQEPVSEDEVPAEETPAEEAAAEEPAEPEPEPEPDESAEAEPEPDADYGYTSESDYEYPQPPEAEPERAKLRGGRVFACVLLGIIPGIPVTVILILASLALLLIGASLAYAGGVAISFAFLGMSVVADILLCVGFGLMVGAVGLVIVFLAVCFFLRCVAGLCSRVFAKAGAWCRGEVRE